MNKNTRYIVLAIIVVVVIGLITWYGGRSTTPVATSGVQSPLGIASSSTEPVAVSATTKSSGSSLLYQNAELGFSIQYPSSWEKIETNNGVQFVMPIDQTQVSTVAKLESDITVDNGPCAFPPVTTIQDRGTINVGDSSLDMISMSNTVQGRGYFNRMYSLQNGSICYIFTFSYISLDPTAKGLTGSNVTQAQNNNKAIQATSDAAFTDMVKSFAFVSTPAGESETQAAPAGK